MEESYGAQFALSVAVQTLKERCLQLQNRVRTLETENISLRGTCSCGKATGDFSELQLLKQQVAELTEKKEQLANNVSMVTMENRKLWSRLSKLMQANKTLGSKLTKIDATDGCKEMSVHVPHNPLIRSKTFTQDAPQTRVLQKNVIDENGKTSSDLEDVSLQLMSALAKEKHELHYQLIELNELHSDDGTFSFSSEGIQYSVEDSFSQHLKDLDDFKNELLQQNQKLRKFVTQFLKMQETRSQIPKGNSKATASVSIQTAEESLHDTESEEETNERICPMCHQVFSHSTDFSSFLEHVECHFLLGGYEVIK